MNERLPSRRDRAARGLAAACTLMGFAAAAAGCGGATTQPAVATGAQAQTEGRAPQAPTATAVVEARPEGARATTPIVPVKATVYAMSRCPYFSDAIQTLIPIVRQLGPALDFEIEYIGHDEGAAGPTSMYGPSGVAGDALQLCAHAYGTTDQWLEFVGCQSAHREMIPDGWQGCAGRANLDVDALRRCAVSDVGRELLRRSFEASTQAGASGSPTFVFGDERYSATRTVDAFGRAICAQYHGAAPPYCQQFPARPPVNVHILFDGRCPASLCDIEAVQREALTKVAGAVVDVQDFRSEVGRAMFQRLGLQLLPAIAIDGPLDEETAQALREYEEVQGTFVKTVGRFDPLTGALRSISVRVLVDARCTTRECAAVDSFEAFIERQLPGVAITRVDVMDADGQALWRRSRPALATDASRQPGLPLAIFPGAIREAQGFYARLERRLVASGDGLLYQLGPWDPDAEVCDNGADDDRDRAVDCRDADCAEVLACRAEKARRLELFMMSQCPYAAKVVAATLPVLDHFKRQRTKIDLRLGWIGTVGADGTLGSMHGPAEIDEDLRQVCAQRHYAKGYRFMDYIACRFEDVRSPEWTQCVREPMKVDVIRTCAEGEEGRTLLRQSFEASKALRIVGSPTWLLNGRYDVTDARETQAIHDAFCARNKVAECGLPIAAPSPAVPASPSATAPAQGPTYVDLILTAQP